MTINGKTINEQTIELGGIYRTDYPEFPDAFILDAWYEDGTQIQEDDLTELNKNTQYVSQQVQKFLF